MRIPAIVLVIAATCSASLTAEEIPAADAAFNAAFSRIRQELQGAPPLSRQNPRDGRDLPTDVIAVARRTISIPPTGFRDFVETYWGSAIAEDLLQAYGDTGPPPRIIDQSTTGGFSVLPIEEFEAGAFAYDWQRLNQKYPEVRHVMRMSTPIVDRLGTYAVVRYELPGRDRPQTYRSRWPWQHASFMMLEKQPDGSWRQTIGRIGAIWK